MSTSNLLIWQCRPHHHQNEIKPGALNRSCAFQTNPVSHFVPQKAQSYFTISRCGLCARQKKGSKRTQFSPRAIPSRRFSEGFLRGEKQRPSPAVNTICKAPFLCQKAQAALGAAGCILLPQLATWSSCNGSFAARRAKRLNGDMQQQRRQRHSRLWSDTDIKEDSGGAGARIRPYYYYHRHRRRLYNRNGFFWHSAGASARARKCNYKARTSSKFALSLSLSLHSPASLLTN